MIETVIDTPTFADLQDAAGAEFVTELVKTFLEEGPAMLAELRGAHAAGAANEFRRAAHSLKSNSSTFGALRLADIARALELGGMPKEAATLDSLEEEYWRVAAALRDLCHE